MGSQDDELSQKNQPNTTILVGRVIWRLIGRLWTTRLTPVLLGLALIYVVFDRAIDLPQLWRQMPEWSMWSMWVFWSSVLVVWSLGVGRWLCPVFYHRDLTVLWCSPIHPRLWGVVWWPLMMFSLVPVLALCMSSPWPWLSLIVATWAAPMFIAASHRSWRGVVCGVIGGAIVGGVMVAATTVWVGVLAMVIAPVMVIALGVVYTQMMGRTWSGGARQVLGGRRRVVSALLQRDLVCIWRTQRLSVILALVVSVLFVLFAFAVARHKGTSAIVLWVLLSVLTPGWMQLVVQVREQQAEQFFPHLWPVSSRQRVLALSGFCGGVIVFIGLCGSVAAIVGQWPWLWWHYGTYLALGLALNGCGLWAGLVESRQPNAGHYVLFGALGLCFLSLAPWWVCWPVSLGCAVLSYGRAHRALARMQRVATSC